MFREQWNGSEGTLECEVLGGSAFLLAWKRRGETLVEYQARGKSVVKTLLGREARYEFKSVEKLRYDFERDVEDALRQG
jgi:hypothetical protein